MPLSSSTPRSNWGWLVALVLILGLWACCVPQVAGQGTKERDKVEKLFIALTGAKKRAGENASGSLESFTSFVQKKTEQIRKQHGCKSVEYSVDVADGKVKLTAKAKA